MSAEPQTSIGMSNNRSKSEPSPSNEPEVPPVNPEPLPDWEIALEEWKGLWQLHFVGFGVLFLAMAVFSCFCVVRIKRRSKGMTLGNYFLSVCLMLMLFSFSRTLFLILDPYESHTVLNLPVIAVRILFAIGYPCLTSALSLIHFAFLEVNKLRMISRRLQNIKFLVSVIATHFVFVFIVYILITLAPKLARLLILCQTILIAWWLVLAMCFLYSAWKVNWETYISAKFFNKTSKETKDRSSSTASTSSLNFVTHVKHNHPPKGAQKIARISGLVSLLALLYVGAELYSLFFLYKLYDLKTENSVDHWSWWAYQTGNRALDFFLCLVIVYVIFPSTQAEKKQHSHSATGESTSARISRNVVLKPTGSLGDRLDAV